SHDCHERALGHVVAIVDRLARPDAGEKLVMFVLIHVIFTAVGRSIAPAMLSLNRVFHDVAHAFGADDIIRHLLVGAVLLAAVSETITAFGKIKPHGGVVEMVAVFWLPPRLSASGAAGAERILVLHRPCHLVETMDMLLDNVVAGEPGEVEPITHLPFH